MSNRVKLKAPRSNGSPAPDAPPEPVPLSPLNISGVVVRKKDLIDALRIFVPRLADFRSFEDEEHFYLMLDGKADRGDGPGA